MSVLKKNFISLFGERLKSCSPSKDQSESPAKRLKLNPKIESVKDDAENRLMETPPLSPDVKIEPRIEVLKREKAEKEMELCRLDQQVESKFNDLKAIRDQTIRIRSKRQLVEDYIEQAKRGQNTVRGLLNDIYNPGMELATQVSSIIEETRKNHAKKFDKLSFELGQHLATSEEAIDRKTNDLKHEIELHKRTLITFECQKQPLQPIAEANETESEKGSHPGQTDQTKQIEQVVQTEHDYNERNAEDDDCVIIADGNTPASDLTEEIDRYTPEIRNTEADGKEAGMNHSETTATCEYDEDEQTDIEEQREEESRSFTPCQAQRPN